MRVMSATRELGEKILDEIHRLNRARLPSCRTRAMDAFRTLS